MNWEEKQSVRKIYLDVLDTDPEPRRGDFLVSEGKKGFGSKYLIMISKRVKRKDTTAPPRFNLIVKRIESLPLKSNRAIFTFHWYSRKKKTFEQHMTREVLVQ